MTVTPDAVEAAARLVFAVEFGYIDRLRGLNPSQRTLDDLDRQEAELIARVAAAAPLIAKQTLLDARDAMDADMNLTVDLERHVLDTDAIQDVAVAWLTARAATLTPKEN